MIIERRASESGLVRQTGQCAGIPPQLNLLSFPAALRLQCGIFRSALQPQMLLEVLHLYWPVGVPMADRDGMAGMAQYALQSEHRKDPPGHYRCNDVKYREGLEGCAAVSFAAPWPV